jgi:hypothetical protein
MNKYLIALFAACALTAASASAQYVPINAELPSQGGHAGAILGTNGTNTSWVATPTPFPGAVVPTPSATGQLLYSANGTTWIVLAIGSGGQCLLSNGSPLIPTWGSCGAGGGPTLAANQTWTGVNAYTNAAGSNFGTPLANNPNLINIAQGVGGQDNYMHLGGDASKICDGQTGDALAFSDSNNGAYITVSSNGASIGICQDTYFTTATRFSNGLFSVASNVQVFPWHPATAPTCTIGLGGTTCTTSSFTPPSASNVCTANAQGTTPPGGVVGETTVSAPGATDTVTYTSVSAIGGGAVVTFNVTCD